MSKTGEKIETGFELGLDFLGIVSAVASALSPVAKDDSAPNEAAPAENTGNASALDGPGEQAAGNTSQEDERSRLSGE